MRTYWQDYHAGRDLRASSRAARRPLVRRCVATALTASLAALIRLSEWSAHATVMSAMSTYNAAVVRPSKIHGRLPTTSMLRSSSRADQVDPRKIRRTIDMSQRIVDKVSNSSTTPGCNAVQQRRIVSTRQNVIAITLKTMSQIKTSLQQLAMRRMLILHNVHSPQWSPVREGLFEVHSRGNQNS